MLEHRIDLATSGRNCLSL